MRNHSHCNRNRLARDGGCRSLQPGRNPGGAKNSAMNPASSSMPSDWYPEKSCAALTKERKQRKQINNVQRGQMLRNTNSDASIPTQQSANRACGLDENQSSVGANQKREEPSDRATDCRYSFAGRIPTGPISPRI